MTRKTGPTLPETGSRPRAGSTRRKPPTSAPAPSGDGTASAKLGLLREHHGDREGALAAYRAGDERGDGFAALRLGLLLAAHGQWREAEEAFARADERGQHEPGFDLSGALRRADEPVAAPAVAAAPSSALASPVLVGALAVLLLVVGVFLAYNANNGLPFVPTRQLKVDIASGSDLVIGNEVREGGFRIGLISDMQAVRVRCRARWGRS